MEERLGVAMTTAGNAIFLTSFTNLIAFVIASTVDFPGVRWFCITAGLVIISLFGLSTTFFAALLCLDERRRLAGKYDCLVCVTSSQGKARGAEDSAKVRTDSSDLGADSGGVSGGGSVGVGMELVVKSDGPGNVATEAALGADADAPTRDGTSDGTPDGPPPQRTVAQRVIRTVVTPLVTNKAGAVAIVVSFVALAVASVSNAGNIVMGISLEDSFPDGSELTEHLSLITDVWADLPASVDVVLTEPNLNDAEVRQRIQNLTTDLEDSDITYGTCKCSTLIRSSAHPLIRSSAN